jgi:predicted TIM-barrel fold metal-dependent hydrolase
VSAPYRLGDNGLARAAALYPYLKASVGVDRLIWGSDWPNTQFEKNENFTVNRAMIDHIIPDPIERLRVLAGGKDLFRF